MKNLRGFSSQLRNEILVEAESSNELTEDAFFYFFSEDLIKAEVIPTADRCFDKRIKDRWLWWQSNWWWRNFKFNCLWFFKSRRNSFNNRAEIDSMCKKAINFISKSLDPNFKKNWIWQVLNWIVRSYFYDLGSNTKIKIVFITNKSLNIRNRDFDPIPINGIHAEFVPWDINRFYDLMISGKEKEEIIINLAEYGGSITALNASSANNDFESYLYVWIYSCKNF